MFYKSIKHGPKAVTPSLKHPIVSRGDWLSNGVVYKTKFCISGLKDTVKRHKWKGNVQMNAQFSFCELKKAFLRNRPFRNSTMFSSRPNAKCPVLKFNQGSEVFDDFAGTFCTL